VVTGATDGIGKAYAHALAALGLNIVLISRTPERLNEVAKELEKDHNVKTKVVAVNFTGGPEIYEVVRKELTGMDIGVLVNNVGMSYDHPEFFLDVAKQTVLDVVNVNILSVTMMTHVVLPDMLKKGKGIVVNISSAAGDSPIPLLSVYSATKSFVTTFSKCIQLEYGHKGIICQNVAPFFVATKLAKMKSTNLFVPSPSQFARAAVGSLGTLDNTHGCLSHDIQGWFRDLVPASIAGKLTLKSMLPVRKKALLRAAKKQ